MYVSKHTGWNILWKTRRALHVNKRENKPSQTLYLSMWFTLIVRRRSLKVSNIHDRRVTRPSVSWFIWILMVPRKNDATIFTIDRNLSIPHVYPLSNQRISRFIKNYNYENTYWHCVRYLTSVYIYIYICIYVCIYVLSFYDNSVLFQVRMVGCFVLLFYFIILLRCLA